jgi:hypothetical protein
MKEYRWTEADILEAKKQAELKHLEWRNASWSAVSIEKQFWERLLADKFQEFEYGPPDCYAALISFDDGDEWCMCKGPVRKSYGGLEMLVWHKGSKGKLRKLADSYECHEIVPLIKEVRRLNAGEVPNEHA